MAVTTDQSSERSDTDPRRIDPDRVVPRLVRDDDVEAIANHLQLCFGNWPPFDLDCSVVEHVEWKLNPNRQSREAQLIATLVDDDHFPIVVSTRHFRPIWIRGEEYLLRSGGDSAVHPDWRRINIREKRREFRREVGLDIGDLSMTWLPHHPATRKSNLLKPSLGNRVLVFWKPSSVRSLVSVPLRSAGWRHAGRTVGDWARARGQSGAQGFNGRIETLEAFDDRTDAVWDAARHEFDLAIVRDQEYLNWRYADPRAGRFVVRAAIEGDELVAYCVSKPSADPASIVDLLARPGRLDAVGALIEDAESLVATEGQRDITCWLPGRHPYAQVLRECGYLDSGRDPSMRYRARDLTEEDLAFLQDPDARLHITHGDSDFI